MYKIYLEISFIMNKKTYVKYNHKWNKLNSENIFWKFMKIAIEYFLIHKSILTHYKHNVKYINWQIDWYNITKAKKLVTKKII